MSDLGTITGASSLADAVHAIWAGNTALCAAVPADRFLTGRVPGSEEMPYVRLELREGGTIQRSNATLYQTQKLAFHVWSDKFDEGDGIAPLIVAAFASMAFDWASGGVTDMRWDGPAAARQTNDPEIKAWETVVMFTVNIWQTRQDG
jgi:hypothetical protein